MEQKPCNFLTISPNWNVKFSLVLALLIWIKHVIVTHAQTPDAPPSVFTQQPDGGQAELIGNTKVLLCSATTANGDPVSVYQWTKDGVLIPFPNGTQTTPLKFQGIQLSDAGLYQCIAVNSFGSLLSSKAQVTVAFMAPYDQTSTQVMNVYEGRAQVFNPPPLGCIPPPEIQWHDVNNTSILYSGETLRYHVTINSQLVALETRQADSGKFFGVTATNSYVGSIRESPIFMLSVQSAGSPTDYISPEIVIPPMNITVVQGAEYVKLECVANSRPMNFQRMNWYRITSSNRTVIQPDNMKYMLSSLRRVLTIRNPSSDDSGPYLCEVQFIPIGSSNQTQSVSAVGSLTVYVKVKPYFINPPPTQIPRPVQTLVVINCQAGGIPTPTIKWYKNAKPVNLPRYEQLNNGSLRINSTSSIDSGIFQCFVTNSVGEINAATWLSIQSYPPTITKSPQNLSIIAGDSAKFDCESTGAPTPTNLWSRVTNDGTYSDLKSGSNQIQVDAKELLIPVVGVDDAGVYTCNATNNMGSVSASAYLGVTVRTRISSPPQNQSIIKGSSASFRCQVTKDPTVTVTWSWTFAKTPLQSGDRLLITADGSLQITAVRNTDIGSYTCFVSSSAGNDTAVAFLTVIELPYSPSITSVSLNVNSIHAVDVNWNPGFDGNSPIRQFILRYYDVTQGGAAPPCGSSWQMADNNIAPNLQTYTVSSLQPARSYQFCVSAVNGVGEGSPSQSSNVISLPQQPPSSPPIGLVGSPRSNSSIVLQWQAPDAGSWNGPLLGYILRYKLSGYPDLTMVYQNITTFQSSMTQDLFGLIVFQEYNISVAAYNAKGVGIYSSSVYVRTLEGRPTDKPQSLTASPIASTAIALSWYLPDPQSINGLNLGYKIFAATPNNISVPPIVVPSVTSNMLGQQMFNLTGLQKYTFYSIRVLCFTSQGDGPSTSPVTVQTLEDVPDAVTGLKFSNVKDTSLVVMWLPPTNTNGILTGFKLTWMKQNMSDPMESRELNATTLNYTVTGLTPTTTYTVQVFAETQVGPGPPVFADIQSGITPVPPSPPTNLGVTNILDRSVVIQFIPGFSGFSSISLWIVEAQMNNIELPSTWAQVYQYSDPGATAIRVPGLSPYTSYRLRINATNVAGMSNASQPTTWFNTLQATPSTPPPEVTVTTISETALQVRWQPLASNLWNGENKKYVVQWKLHSSPNYTSSYTSIDETTTTYRLTGLLKWRDYDVQVASSNNIGFSNFSTVVTAKTLESVPSAGPTNLSASAVSSTSIQVTWSEVPTDQQNGLILGYKIYYQSQQAGSSLNVLTINFSNVTTANITGLSKFVWYTIQALAFTSIGDGVLTPSPVLVRTFEDVPGPPSGIYFPEVTDIRVTVVWSVPSAPNGIITGYSVSYGLQGDPQKFTNVDDQLDLNTRSYTVSNLLPNSIYAFAIAAKTQSGWGQPGQLLVYTSSDRKVPGPPNQPSVISLSVGDRFMTVVWTYTDDIHSLIRNFTIQYRMNNSSQLNTVDAFIPPDATEYTVTSLKPNSLYQFQIAAWNDVGVSNYSQPSQVYRTLQAAPDSPPMNLTLVASSATSMLVQWQAPPLETWNGPLLGYEVFHREANSKSDWITDTVNGINQNTFTINNVQLFQTYEVKVRAYNVIGRSDFSSAVTLYMEIAPSATVQNFKVENVTSTQILISWQAPPTLSWNGYLLGYRIQCSGNNIPSNNFSLTVLSTSLQATLPGLQPNTLYNITVLAFNAAGNGPTSDPPMMVSTLQDIPSQPTALSFVVTTLTSLNITWDSPIHPNGVLVFYEVSYYQNSDLGGVKKSVQVQLPTTVESYFIQSLIESMNYVVSVRAQTAAGWGQATTGNITIGPQAGCPGPPSKPSCVAGDKYITIKWTNGDPGAFPIDGSLVQSQIKNDVLWKTELTTDSPASEAQVSILNIKPSTDYQFRVINFNKKGIGFTSEPSDSVRTIDVLAQMSQMDKPYYQQWWFLVIIALIGLIVIIVVTSILCVTGKRRMAAARYKENLSRTTIQLSTADQGRDDYPGFTAYEIRQSQRSQHYRQQSRQPSRSNSRATSRNGTLPTNSRNGTLPTNSRAPPRPSPGSINFYSDEDQKSSQGDSSSLSEKASDISTVRSHATDSDVETLTRSTRTRTPAATFANHYVNDNVMNSWKRNNGPSNIYNFGTDSEQDSSHYAFNLNSNNIAVNNVAGSRAPLPNFSSFV